MHSKPQMVMQISPQNEFFIVLYQLTQELGEPDGLVVVLHSHGARVEEHQHNHEPEPGGGLQKGKGKMVIYSAIHIL